MQSKGVQKGYLVRLDRGEEILETLTDFCNNTGIKTGWISALGSVQEAELSFFDLGKKEYVSKEFKGMHEIASLTGNISKKEGEIHIHAHAVLGDTDMKSHAGHVMRAVVGATCEVFIVIFEGKVLRTYDENTGLYLLDL